MHSPRGTWLKAVKWLLTAAILYFVGRQFARDLKSPELWEHGWRLGWLGASGALYVGGLGCFALYWYRLLWLTGQRPTLAAAVRAYSVGLLGKYLPGKVGALVLRAGLVRGPGVDGGVAGITALYEVLTTMATGALLAAALFAGHGAGAAGGWSRHAVGQLLRTAEPTGQFPARGPVILLAVGLFAGVGTPAVPALFNWLAGRVSLPFRADGLPPPVPWRAPLEGAAYAAVGWFLMGLAVLAGLHGPDGASVPLDGPAVVRVTAYLTLAYVAGFIILIVPSGLGVREYFLTLFLVPELVAHGGLPLPEARAQAVLVVLALRLAWTVAELVLAGVVYWLPGPRGPGADVREGGRA